MADATIDWTSNDAAVLRTLGKVETGFDKLAQRMDRVETASKKATQQAATGFDKVATSISRTASALIGGGSLLTALDMVKDKNLELIRLADEAAKKQDDMMRRFRVQANLDQIQGRDAQAWIMANAERNAVPLDVATGGALGLVGAGFAAKDATGAGLNALLRARAATNATGGNADDLEGLATSVAAYLQSQGMAKTPANLNSVLQGGFALRQTGAFELSDLTELGKHGAAFRGLLSMQEQLAAFGTLVDQMPSAEAATSLRNIVSRLSTSQKGRTSVKALAEIGLTPADVDLVGEDFMTAMSRVEGGLAGIPEANRAGVLKQLFEEAGVAPARALMRERTGRFAEYMGSIQGVGAAYGQTVDVAQSGITAAEIRATNRRNRILAQQSAGDTAIQSAMDEQFAMDPTGSPARRFMAEQGYWALRGYGFSPETAAGMAYNDVAGAGTNRTTRAMSQRSRDTEGPVRVEVVNPAQDQPPPAPAPLRGFQR